MDLADLYAEMDTAVTEQFPGRFATAQMGELDTDTGELTWVNAGHPAPMLLRGRRMIGELEGPTTRPVGFGGATPLVQTRQLQPGDRVLFSTDGVVDERLTSGEQFSEDRLVDLLERAGAQGISAPKTIRRLSRTLMSGRAGQTSDDATLFLLKWSGPDGEDDLRRNLPL